MPSQSIRLTNQMKIDVLQADRGMNSCATTKRRSHQLRSRAHVSYCKKCYDNDNLSEETCCKIENIGFLEWFSFFIDDKKKNKDDGNVLLVSIRRSLIFNGVTS